MINCARKTTNKRNASVDSAGIRKSAVFSLSVPSVWKDGRYQLCKGTKKPNIPSQRNTKRVLRLNHMWLSPDDGASGAALLEMKMQVHCYVHMNVGISSACHLICLIYNLDITAQEFMMDMRPTQCVGTFCELIFTVKQKSQRSDKTSTIWAKSK